MAKARPRIDFDGAKPFKVDGVYCRLISLTRGMLTIVNDSDYMWLSQWNWRAKLVKSTNTFYALRNSSLKDGRRTAIYMHREILGLKFGDPREVDHIRSNETLNNSRSNLRVATHAENMCNRQIHRNNACGYKGVRFNRKINKWQAVIWLDRKQTHLGSFETPEGAHEAYKCAAAALHGEFARFR